MSKLQRGFAAKENSYRPERRRDVDTHVKTDFSRLRYEMVDKAIVGRGVRSELVLNAMRDVPREAFLPRELREFAYEDAPLPIEGGQTISQPYIVAFMTEALALEGGETVLEIGTGSGYAAAILSKIVGEVYTVERIGQLAEKAASTLADLGHHNVHVLHGDGTKGWPEHAPFDGIIVAAGGPAIPESLKEQLKLEGRRHSSRTRSQGAGARSRHPHFRR
jgi:protein-L-isoaspartate(D-aspartate) O-methyltransferase